MLKSDNLERAHLLVEMARVAEQLKEDAKAIKLYDDALAQFSTDSLDPFLIDVLRWKGSLLRDIGVTEAAFRCYVTSLEKARLIESDKAQAHALNCLGTIAQRRCNDKETERLYSEASQLAEKAGDARLLGMIEQNRGVLASRHGDFEQAVAFLTNSLAAFELADDREASSWVLNNLGMLHSKIRNFGEAREHLERGLEIAVNRGDVAVANIIKLNIAEVWLGLGALDTADECCAAALQTAQRRGDHLTAAGALRVRAAIERQRGAFDKSIATLRIAIYEAAGAEDWLLHAELLRELGEISRAAGNSGAARSAWREAVDSFRIAGATQELAEVQAEIHALAG
ncbi:MAG TPA: tetratricopeptide repeat protein [Gemmatimonadaceae bacterium]